MIRIQVQKGDNETTGSLIRRFTKKVQTANLVRQAKQGAYWERPKSDYVKKKSALKRIIRQKEYARLVKLGKIRNVYHKKSR